MVENGGFLNGTWGEEDAIDHLDQSITSNPWVARAANSYLWIW